MPDIAGLVFLGASSGEFDPQRLNTFTIAAWIKLDQIIGGNRVVEKGDSNSYWLDINPDSRPLVGFYNNNFNDLISDKNVESNTWYFLAGTYDGNILKIYIDGVINKLLEIASNPNQNTEPLIIGWKYNGIDEDRFSGLIDELRIYNRALSELEIQQLYFYGQDNRM